MSLSAKTATLKKNYHQTFEVRKGSVTITRHTLLLNPQSLSQAEQSRSSVTQTLGGAYVTDFGSALPQVTIGGTTGYKQRYNDDAELRDGYEEFIHFRNEVYRKFVETNDPDYTMFWYNWEDEEYYQIQPTSFRLQKSVSEALLYRYEFAFTCLCKAYTNAVKPANLAGSPDFVALAVQLSSSISSITEINASLS